MHQKDGRSRSLNCEELRRAAFNLSVTCGILALIGCLGVVVGQVVGLIVVEQHNPISETISKLAIGPYAWIQDLGLDFFAGGAVACGVGLYAWNLGRTGWKVGSFSLIVLGAVVILIAEHNQYAGGDGRGAAIHRYLVYAFGVLFACATGLTAKGLERIHPRWKWGNWAFTLVWVISAPIFYFVPTAWDGAYERMLGLIVLVWTLAIAGLLLRRGTGQLLEEVEAG